MGQSNEHEHEGIPTPSDLDVQSWTLSVGRFPLPRLPVRLAHPTGNSYPPPVKLPDAPDDAPSGKVPRSALIIMVVMLAGMVTVAIYANVQHWKRDQIETVIVTPVATPIATP